MNKGGNSINAQIYNKIANYYNRIFGRWCTICTYVKARLQSVEIGKGCHFSGMPVFLMNIGGYVSIGRNGIFLSSKYANPLGLSHACIFSVYPAYEGDEAHITIGERCGMSGTTIRCFKEIFIGNNVRIGANVLIIDGDGHFDDYRTSPPQPIHIEDDVFIGANCVVKKGVTIGKHSVIGMNSVVTKDIPPYSVAVGVPARVVRKIEKV